MTDYLVLTDFVPGTKAKAQEVNANFSAVKDAINSKALAGGDSNLTFRVAAATENSHAVAKSQLDALSENFEDKITATASKFCVKSGNTTGGSGDLFSYSSLTITSKVGGAHANLVISDYLGTFTEISSVPSLSMSGKSDGIYNIFIAADGIPYALKNTIYQQAVRPTLLDGDVWLNTSVEPIKAIKYNGTSDVEFLGVPLGAVTILSSAITKIETFAFNQNGYDINLSTKLNAGDSLTSSILNLIAPDYTRRVGLGVGTNVTITKNGWIFVNGRTSTSGYYVSINGVVVGQTLGVPGAWEEQMDIQVAVSVGDVVYVITNGFALFAPCRGSI